MIWDLFYYLTKIIFISSLSIRNYVEELFKSGAAAVT